MKNKINRLILNTVVALFLLLNLSATKGNWSGLNLTKEEISASINFQLSRGSTCITEFKSVSSILNKFIENKIDATRLNEVLGNENIIINNNEKVYYLSSNENESKAILQIKNKQLISFLIVDNK